MATVCRTCGKDYGEGPAISDGLCPRCVLTSVIDEEPGELFAGRYELLEQIGRGGMGVVYRARDTRLDRIVALKGVDVKSPEEYARFQREAKMAARLNHPNIVQVHDVETDGDQTFLTMEFVDGSSLAAAPSDIRDGVEAVRQVALALHYAHEQGVIHRDVKPENILVDREGRVRLADFGLARPVEASSLTVSGGVLGTPGYLSPEQARGRRADARSDVYGLGGVLYYLLMGRPPNEGKELYDILLNAIRREPDPPQCATDLRTIVMKCLEKDPGLRYGAAAELAEDLRRYSEGEEILARPPSVFERFRRTVRKRKTLAVGVAGGIAVAAVLLLFVPPLLRTSERLEYLEDLRPLEGAIRDSLPFFYAEHADMEEKLDRIERAVGELERLAEDPAKGAHVEVWRTIGMGRYFLSDMEGAEEAFLRALNLDAVDGESNYYLGRIYLERSILAIIPHEDMDVEEARRRMRKWGGMAVEHMGRAAKGWDGAREIDMHLAATFLARARGERGKALEMCEEGLERFGEVMGAEEYWILRSIDTTEEFRLISCRKALEIKPHHAFAHLLIGVAHYVHEEDAAHALEHYDRAAALRLRDPRLFLNRGLVRERNGDIRGAEEDFTEAMRLAPGDPGPCNLRGLLRRRDGRLEDAVRDYAEAIRRREDFAGAWNNRGVVWLKLEKPDEALHDFSTAIRLDGTSPKPFLNRGHIWKDRKEYDRAMADYDRATELDPDLPEPYRSRGDVYMDRRAWKRAFEEYSRALEKNPRYLEAWVNRGAVRHEIGDYAGQIADYEKALEVAPPDWKHRKGLRRVVDNLKRDHGDD